VIQSKVRKFDPDWPNGPVDFAVNPDFPDQWQISGVLSLFGLACDNVQSLRQREFVGAFNKSPDGMNGLSVL